MRRWAAAALALVLAALTTAEPAAAKGPVRAAAEVGTSPVVMLVVDISGSMNDNDGAGTIKIEGAKRALLNVLDSLPVTALVGLRAYPSGNCGAGTTYGPGAAGDEKLRSTVRGLTADGGTPTGPALRAAADDVLAAGGTATIVLVSDGESNCGENPCDVAKAVALEGVDITVNTVGFDISAAGATELTCIADATGGRYFNADDTEALQRSIDEAATPRLDLVVDDPKPDEVVGAGSVVTVAATVRNISALRLDDVRTQLTFPPAPDNVDPGIVGPIKYLGNLAAGEAKRVQWQYRVDPRQDGASSRMLVHAAAANASPRKVALTIRYADPLDLSRAGPLLRNAKHPVILGDSYSSGEGAGGYFWGTDLRDLNRCHRSEGTYGMTLWPAKPALLACSGATTADIDAPNRRNIEPAQTAALARLATTPDLVLMTIGGNDVGFADVIKHCVLTPSPCQSSPVYPNPAVSGPCLLAYTATGAWSQPLMTLPGCEPFSIPYGVEAFAKIDAIGPDLLRVYGAVDDTVNSDEAIERRHGTIAPIVVLAYPKLTPYYPDNRGFCSRFLSADELRFGAAFTEALNQKIEGEVAKAREIGIPIYFAEDVADSFLPNHTICDREPHAVREVLWRTALGLLESAVLPAPLGFGGQQQEQLHPNPSGYLDMTASLVRWSNRPEAAGPVTRDRSGRYAPIPLGTVEGTIVLDQAPHDSAGVFQPGDGIVLQGSGYTPGDNVSIVVHSAPRGLGAATVDEKGSFSVEVRLPADLAPGAHALIATGLDPAGRERSLFAVVEVRRPLSWWSIGLWVLAALLTVSSGGALGLLMKSHVVQLASSLKRRTRSIR